MSKAFTQSSRLCRLSNWGIFPFVILSSLEEGRVRQRAGFGSPSNLTSVAIDAFLIAFPETLLVESCHAPNYVRGRHRSLVRTENPFESGTGVSTLDGLTHRGAHSLSINYLEVTFLYV
jgi:hypothetical protein